MTGSLSAGSGRSSSCAALLGADKLSDKGGQEAPLGLVVRQFVITLTQSGLLIHNRPIDSSHIIIHIQNARARAAHTHARTRDPHARGSPLHSIVITCAFSHTLGSHSHWAIVLYESIVLQRKGPATTRIRRPTS